MTLTVPSLSVGYLFVSFELPKPWPVAHPTLFMEYQLLDGFLLIGAMPNGTIEVSLRSLEEGQSGFIDRLGSPEIHIGAYPIAIICVIWKDSKISELEINRQTVSPTTDFTGRWIVGNKMPGGNFDYSIENEEARENRYSAMQGIRDQPKRKPGGKDYLLSALADEAEQLEDLIEALKRGRESHVLGLASRLRILIIDKPLGLLQHCAAFNKLPLIVYSNRAPESQLSIDSAIIFDSAASAEPTSYNSNPVDLDVWLRFSALTIKGKSYSHRDVIKDVGDTIGAHRDRGITNVVQALQMPRTQDAKRYRGIQRYIMEIAQVVLRLSHFVLSASENSRNS